MANCITCGEKISFLSKNVLCPSCMKQGKKDLIEEEKQQEKEMIRVYEKAKVIYKNVLVSTTPTLEGYRIVEYLGIESAEVIVGTSIIKDFRASFSDFFGNRSGAYESSLSNAKKEAFEILKFKAACLEGNGIIGIDIDYMEIGENMLGVIVGGTIVRLEKYN
ncbi:YbjQ family protein [Paraclostridium sordellii]|uniref:YbjQ family protein n=1 Tax=Paraclostridium sordellii TaxID=1505 RepID=UPI0022E37C0C|nr:YbjQ family protein [Paeniclostridium sordellii]